MTTPNNAPDRSLRLNVFLARAGHGSRRGVEDLVRAGRVSIDGKVVRDLAVKVDPATTVVTVDGMRAVLPEGTRVYAFHKPLGVVSTMQGQGDQVDLAALRRRADIEPRFHPVGRLDRDSSGLLLWTDDGQLSQALLRPEHGVWKMYEVHLAAPLKFGAEQRLITGRLKLDGRPIRECRMELDPGGDRRRWVIQLHEGRNRQVRRMFAAVDGKVLSLVRVAFGPIELGRLRPGDFRRLTAAEEEALRDAAGLGNAHR